MILLGCSASAWWSDVVANRDRKQQTRTPLIAQGSCGSRGTLDGFVSPMPLCPNSQVSSVYGRIAPQAAARAPSGQSAERPVQAAQPRVAGGSPGPAHSGTDQAIALPTARATSCHSRGSQPSAAATSDVS
jgi:hypothetical protein